MHVAGVWCGACDPDCVLIAVAGLLCGLSYLRPASQHRLHTDGPHQSRAAQSHQPAPPGLQLIAWEMGHRQLCSLNLDIHFKCTNLSLHGLEEYTREPLY